MFSLISQVVFKKHQNLQKGFSIMEVMITIFIVGLVTAVVVAKYGSFNNVVLLKTQAYEIALDLREAQAFAVSVRGQNATFREDYGLYFDLSSPTEYILFRDRGDATEGGKNVAYYDSGEEIDTYNIDSRFVVTSICVNIVSSIDLCPASVNDLSITFRRPNFDAQFASVSGKAGGNGVIDNARITLSNENDATISRVIVVNNTGQISIE